MPQIEPSTVANVAPFTIPSPILFTFGSVPSCPPASPQPDAWPDLMTAAEAVRYLRLDQGSTKHPERTLGYYRRKWKLRGTQIGRSIRYRRQELDGLMQRITGNDERIERLGRAA